MTALRLGHHVLERLEVGFLLETVHPYLGLTRLTTGS